MAQGDSHNIYILGSKVYGSESIIVTDKDKLSITTAFDTLDEAKGSFRVAYDTLLAPSFRPSIPPSDEELHYHQEFMRLIAFYPIIIELNREDGSNILKEWKDDSSPIFQTPEKFYKIDYWHCPMRTGFFKKYGVLDIAKDIETTPFVGTDGKMVIRINKIDYGPDNRMGHRGLSEEEIDELLRKRGYL